MTNKTKIKFENVSCDGMFSEKVIVNTEKGTIKLKAKDGYAPDTKGEILADLKDDGNGVTIYGCASMGCIDLSYSDLDHLRTLLNVWVDYFEVKPEKQEDV